MSSGRVFVDDPGQIVAIFLKTTHGPSLWEKTFGAKIIVLPISRNPGLVEELHYFLKHEHQGTTSE